MKLPFGEIFNKFKLLRKIVIASIFCIILLFGVIAGLLIFPPEKAKLTYAQEQEPFIDQQEQTEKQKYNALDPVSGDWGITADELVSRINITLDKVGIRSGKIRQFNVSESGKEFRHSFSPMLSVLGELSDINNVRRVALFFDPAFDKLDFPLAMSVIRALIAAIDPSLTREDIVGMMDSLGISIDEKIPPRQAELRHKNFMLRIWSVAGSAFAFTVSSDY